MRYHAPTPRFLALPLYIAPYPEEWPLPKGVKTRHHRYWPSNDPLLRKPESRWPSTLEQGGWALRNSGVQDAIDIDHNNGQLAYHTLYGRPVLPRTVEAIMGCLMLETAGCIPEQALDMRSGKPRAVILSAEQRAILQQPLPNQAIGYANVHHRWGLIYDFASSYVAEQSLSHLRNPYLCEEFVDPKITSERRRELGHILLTQQIEVAIDSVRDDFEAAARLELLDPRLNRTGYPISPIGFVNKHMLGSKQRQEQNLFPKIAAAILAEQQSVA